MNLLAAVMPGIREARTPLSIGALWMVCIFLFVAPHSTGLAYHHAGISWLSMEFGEVPQLYGLGIITFAAYLVGVASQPISLIIGKGILRPFFRAQYATGYPDGILRRAFQDFVRRRLAVREYLGPISDVITSEYVKAGLPANMSLHYPNYRVLDRLDATALQLWTAHPDQYQEYDRLRAERDFRRGVWLPVVGIGVAIGALVTWWLGLLIAVGGFVLLYQTWGLDYRRTVLIATALFQNLIEDAELKAMVQALAKIVLPPNWRERESVRCAITAVAFAKTGDFDSADNLTWEAANAVLSDAIPERNVYGARIDVDSQKSKGAIEEIAGEVREVYRANDEADEIQVFDARLKKTIAEVAAAGRAAPALLEQAK